MPGGQRNVPTLNNLRVSTTELPFVIMILDSLVFIIQIFYVCFALLVCSATADDFVLWAADLLLLQLL